VQRFAGGHGRSLDRSRDVRFSATKFIVAQLDANSMLIDAVNGNRR
jgi:hypothetical protein